MYLINISVLICIALALAVTVGADSSIDNGAVGMDGTPCDPLRDPQGCRPLPANPYNRGCSKINRCRGNEKQDASDGIAPVEGEAEERIRGNW